MTHGPGLVNRTNPSPPPCPGCTSGSTHRLSSIKRSPDYPARTLRDDDLIRHLSILSPFALYVHVHFTIISQIMHIAHTCVIVLLGNRYSVLNMRKNNMYSMIDEDSIQCMISQRVKASNQNAPLPFA